MSAPVRLGRYRVERRLGSGAFATVWLAQDEVLLAPVAVKVLADNWAHQLDVMHRFLEEARILRRADSDRVVRVHDIGELDDGRPYFVMTYADRGTLADRIAAGPLPVPLALRYGADTALGVAVLHDVGVIHRDLTPANVLLRSARDGSAEQILIADLGLAKAAARASGFTLSVGTAGYMAPEQAVPGGGLDSRADVYGVAALVHAMLTGQPPASDGPGAVAETVPARVAAVLTRALASRPADRYDSATTLAEALLAAGEAMLQPGQPADGEPATPAVSLADTLTLRLPALIRPDPDPDEAVGLDEPEAAGTGSVPPLPDRRAQPARRPTTGRRPAPAPSRGRRRRRVGVLVAALLAVAATAGVVAAQVWRRPGSVAVTNASGSLRVDVPSAWAGQYQDSTWDLTPYGQRGKLGVALVVARDVAGWRDAGSDTPGVFVGRASGLAADPVLARSAAAGCPAAGRHWEHAGLAGTVLDHASCGGAARFVEAVLSPTDSSFLVYVQVKEPAGGDAAAGVLDSLAIGPLS